VGVGFSINSDPKKAVEEAVDMALRELKEKTVDFTIVFTNSGSDTETMFLKLKELLGSNTKIYGGSSDSRWLMTNKGLITIAKTGYLEVDETKNAITLMAISSKKINFGVGSADFSRYASAKEAAKEALSKAIKTAGRSLEEKPKVILTLITPPYEEEVLEAIEEMIGKETILLGGTVGGPEFIIFGENQVYTQGVSLAVIYTDLAIGWTFEGGFKVRLPQTGIVTKAQGQEIIEIDNRPALDVYNNWLGGKIESLSKQTENPEKIRDFFVLYPLYRKYTTKEGIEYYLFSHPWPKDFTFKKKSIMTSTYIKEGQRIYLSQGNWEALLNRILKLSNNAKTKADIKTGKTLFGIAYLCAGVIGVIPQSEREKIPFLIMQEEDFPFICCFSWGEQGFFPGIGFKHGNLLTSFLIISEEEEEE
ncbi:MAG: FIST N-terminal domain-containing protein, partial [Candidatus Aenigmatarchaeota archaeon]